jgi:hypothetical protein
MTTPMVNPEFIYKIAPKALFDASIAAGKFLGATSRTATSIFRPRASSAKPCASTSPASPTS